MFRLFFTLLCLSFLIQPADAYKEFSYNENGERVYRTISQEDFAKYKKFRKRTFVYHPRTNWEITDSMRARKMTISQYTHRN